MKAGRGTQKKRNREMKKFEWKLEKARRKEERELIRTAEETQQ